MCRGNVWDSPEGRPQARPGQSLDQAGEGERTRQAPPLEGFWRGGHADGTQEPICWGQAA